MRSLAISIGLLALTISAWAEEIKINFVRPTRLLGMLANAAPNSLVSEATGPGSLLPDGVRVKADDRKRVLEVFGDTDAIEELKRYISLFDVQSRSLKVSIDIACPLEDFRNRSETTMRNNTSWGIEESVSGAKVTVAVRVNDDGTITFLATVGKPGYERTFTARTKVGEPIEIAMDQLLGTDREKVKDLIQPGSHKTLIGTPKPYETVISIRAWILEPERGKG